MNLKSNRYSACILVLASVYALQFDPPALAQSPTQLTYIAGSSAKVEQIIGDCDWQAKDGNCSPTASQTVTEFNTLGMYIGSSFEYAGKAVFLFGDSISQDTNLVNYRAGDALAWTTSTDPEAGLQLNFYMKSEGSPLFVRPPGINMGGNNVPNAGISLSDGVYVLCNVGADSLAGKPSDHSILVRFDEASRSFTTLRTVSTLPGHFVSGSMHE